MGRSPSITNEQILAAARALFLAEGFGASTADIARRAGISEGSIFKRFSTKEKLFFAAMGHPERNSWINDLKELPGKGNVRENLIMLSIKVLDFLREALPRMVMMQSKGGFPPLDDQTSLNASSPKPPHFAAPPIIQDLRAVTAFLDQELKLGRIRACNTEILAHIWLGSLTHYVLMEQMMPAHNQQKMSVTSTDYVHGLVENLWQGIAPP
jgi:AcrR family transcriptional regulator